MGKIDVITEAHEWIGTPYKHQKRKKGVACDCIGLVYGVAEKINAAPKETPEDYKGYSRFPDSDKLKTGLNEYMEKIRLSDIRPGDVLLMQFYGEPYHLAIYAGDTIIHSYSVVKKVVEHSLSQKWKRRICGAYRFKQWS